MRLMNKKHGYVMKLIKFKRKIGLGLKKIICWNLLILEKLLNG